MVTRTQKEIRQRAPLWLLGLLMFNLGLLSYHAKDQVTKQRMIRVWGQAIASPFQRVSTGVGGAGVGVFQRIGNLRYAAAENEGLKQRVAEMETALRDARAERDENQRLRACSISKTNPITA